MSLTTACDAGIAEERTAARDSFVRVQNTLFSVAVSFSSRICRISCSVRLSPFAMEGNSRRCLCRAGARIGNAGVPDRAMAASARGSGDVERVPGSCARGRAAPGSPALRVGQSRRSASGGSCPTPRNRSPPGNSSTAISSSTRGRWHPRNARASRTARADRSCRAPSRSRRVRSRPQTSRADLVLAAFAIEHRFVFERSGPVGETPPNPSDDEPRHQLVPVGPVASPAPGNRG